MHWYFYHQHYNSVRPHIRQPTRLPPPWDSPGKNTGVGCHFLLQCMKVKSESEGAQSCPTVSDPIDCRLPGSSVHGIFQARVLEWVAIAFSESKEGQCQRMFKNRTTAFISHASKVMLKTFQARLQQYVNQELPDVQAVFREGRGTRNQIAIIHWIIGKAKEFLKTSNSASLTTLSVVWIATNCGKFFKRWEYRPLYLPPKKPV